MDPEAKTFTEDNLTEEELRDELMEHFREEPQGEWNGGTFEQWCTLLNKRDISTLEFDQFVEMRQAIYHLEMAKELVGSASISHDYYCILDEEFVTPLVEAARKDPTILDYFLESKKRKSPDESSQLLR